MRGSESQHSGRALEPYRVLDLTDEKGNACGRVLADMGADVIKLEKPSGDTARSIGPFYGDIPHPEKSLYWFTYNAGKRSVTLNIECADGQEIFRRLLERADFVIESFPPGYMEGLGLGYSELSQVNPRVIMVSITPFGQTGPYRDFKGPQIVLWAMSGMMCLTGEPDQPPVQISVPHLYYHAGAQAAAAGLMAVNWRKRTGEGQFIDISMRDAVIWSTLHTQQFWDLNKISLAREGVWRKFGENRIRIVFLCKDGQVIFRLFGGPAFAPGQRALVEWMDSEGMASEALKSFKWEEMYSSTVSTELADEISEAFGRFFLTKTKSELWQGALKGRFALAPANTIKELVESPHFVGEGFWFSLEHDALGESITYPGPPVRLSGTAWSSRRRAPLIGEHNEEVYEEELGLTREKLRILKQAGVI
ncbi:CaiB/BaiF CoA transferase family protein [Chloroflexota bacterium]